jgi:anti-sigma factor RsiW
MNCDTLTRRITELHEGVLSPDDCAEVERHLAECPSCGRFQEELRAVARLCQQAKGDLIPPMPADLRTRIARLIDAGA